MNGTCLGYGPQGFALEVNPWQTEGSVNAVLLYRGAIVAGWANVESTLIELAIRASMSDQYRHLRNVYPTTTKKRIAYLLRVFEADGPLRSYNSVAHAVLGRFVQSEDMRNMMAHARMTVLPDWGATFHFYRPKTGAEIMYHTARYTEVQLAFWARRATRFSRAVRRMMSRIDDSNLLPPLAQGEE